ncbi:helix-turn-helix transcriptional regulator [Kitasatospora sp. NPDC052896]|uniref:helix-turn-helix transcriptional regulator n=1 Tax=Kitasatospora sp. NPDC052896 TaxID=3364061 RepID=UPI0037C801A3
MSVLVLSLAHACPAPTSAGAASEVFRSFRAAVERDFARSHHVADYAAALGYSVRTLTRAAQAATGFTAKQYIDARILLEARRLLAHTDATSAEISRRVGFHDPSDFAKFFRTRDGNAPLRFREVARGRTPGVTSRPHAVVTAAGPVEVTTERVGRQNGTSHLKLSQREPDPLT